MLRKSFGGVTAAALITGVALAFAAPASVSASGDVATASIGQARAFSTDGPRRRTHSRRAVFRFRGAANFVCSLNSTRYRSCDSPARITGLARGRSHRFRVRAVLPDGRRTRADIYHWRIRF
jgi:hypothetical protein